MSRLDTWVLAALLSLGASILAWVCEANLPVGFVRGLCIGTRWAYLLGVCAFMGFAVLGVGR